MSAAASAIPTQQELFDRLSQVADDMTTTCSQVEKALSDADPELMSVEETCALQNLDRMTQNLADISKLLQRLSQAEDPLERSAISDALQGVLLPSLKSYLQNGDTQDDQGSVDLF